MTNAKDEFIHWLKETFDEDYDDSNIDHRVKLAVFEAGWDARG